jgi:hypothetical protein
MNGRNELHRIKMPPGTLWSKVRLRAIAFALRASQPFPAEFDANINGLMPRLKLNICYTPVKVKT